MTQSARYDDGFRGPGVADSYRLSECWIQLLQTEVAWPEASMPPRMEAFLRATYPPDQISDAISSIRHQDASETALRQAIMSGDLTLWTSPIEGPADRVIDHTSLLELGRETIISGCYRPYNDRQNWAYGRPLFIKKSEWDPWLSKLRKRYMPPMTSDLEGRCRKWLEQSILEGRTGTRGDWLEAALTKFPALSKRAFERAWRSVADRHGLSRPGRPRKTSQ